MRQRRKLNGATQQAARRPVMGRLAETEMEGRGNFYRVVYARVCATVWIFNGTSPAEDSASERP